MLHAQGAPHRTCAMTAARQEALSKVLLPPVLAPVSSSMPGWPPLPPLPPPSPPRQRSFAWMLPAALLASRAGFHSPCSHSGGALPLLPLLPLPAEAAKVGRQKAQPGGAAAGCVAAAKPASTSRVESALNSSRNPS